MKKNLKKNDVSVIITDFVFKKMLLENTSFAARLISWICNLDYEKVVKGHFIDPNLSARKSIEVHRVGDLIYKIDDNILLFSENIFLILLLLPSHL